MTFKRANYSYRFISKVIPLRLFSDIEPVLPQIMLPRKMRNMLSRRMKLPVQISEIHVIRLVMS